MLSLTDRMAAALRSMRDNWDASAETFIVPTVEARAMVQQLTVLLAEYDAERNPPQPPKITAGSHVRCTRASKKSRSYQVGDEAKVQYLATAGLAVVVWLTDLGDDHLTNRSPFLQLADCELVLNLPATNTGD